MWYITRNKKRSWFRYVYTYRIHTEGWIYLHLNKGEVVSGPFETYKHALFHADEVLNVTAS